jgi:hypothetical protein
MENIRSEREWSRSVRRNLPGHFSMVESPDTSPGIPDLNWFYFDREVWLELKVKAKLRKGQYVWMKRRVGAGATNVYILWHHKGGWFLIKAKDAVELKLHLTENNGLWMSRAIECMTWHDVIEETRNG